MIFMFLSRDSLANVLCISIILTSLILRGSIGHGILKSLQEFQCKIPLGLLQVIFRVLEAFLDPHSSPASSGQSFV